MPISPQTQETYLAYVRQWAEHFNGFLLFAGFDALNPNGIASQSPGLRPVLRSSPTAEGGGTSYPGKTPPKIATLKGLRPCTKTSTAECIIPKSHESRKVLIPLSSGLFLVGGGTLSPDTLLLQFRHLFIEGRELVRSEAQTLWN